MERTVDEAKLNPASAGREIKRVADAGKLPIVVPIVVVAVDVHVALVVVPPIERGRIVRSAVHAIIQRGSFRIRHL